MTYRDRTYRRRDILRLTLLASAAGVAHQGFDITAARAERLLPLSPLQPPDANGWRLAEGFTSRLVAESGQIVAGTAHTWHTDPDGGAVFAQPDGSYIYVSNNEGPPLAGGVGAIHFEADGTIRSARSLLEGSERNCAGGATPWGTWLSCEERTAGRVWEVDPTGATPPIEHHGMGHFFHEAAAADPDRRCIYMTEDRPDGGLYRFTPTVWGDLRTGVLQVLAGAPGALDWSVVPDPISIDPPTRHQVADMVAFNSGEGLVYLDEAVFFSTKGDDRIWQLTTDTLELSIIHDPVEQPATVLNGVDNLAIAPNGDLVVCEDSGDMELVLLQADGATQVLAQLSGVSGSELTGAAFDPTGTRLYVSSQRNPGATYELSGPFAGPPPLPRFETDHPTMELSGAWSTWSHPSQSAGSAQVSDAAGSTLRVMLDGRSIRVIGQRGPGRASATVRIDGADVAPIVSDAPTFTSQTTLFSTDQLAAGAHLLEIVHTGPPGAPLVLDALQAASISAPPPIEVLERIESDDPDWTYSGDWFTWVHPSQSEGTAAVGRGSATAMLPFSGTRLRLIAQAGPDRARVDVRVDAVLVATVDTWAPSYASRQIVLDLADLVDGHHELELVVNGAHPDAIGDPALVLDAVEANRGLQPPLVRIEDDDPRMIRTGNWSTWSHPSQSGGSAAVARGLGTSMTVRFRGTSIRWIGQRGPDRAIGLVAIDGAHVTTVDTHHGSFESQRVLFSRNGLTDAVHTLTITFGGVNPLADLAPGTASLLVDALEAEGFD